MSDATNPSPEGSSAAETRWRLRFGDQVFGPYDRSELEALLNERRLDRQSLLAEEGRGEDWRPAGEIPALAALFEGRSLPAKAKPPPVARSAGQAGPDPMMLHLVYGMYAASFFVPVTALVGVIIAYIKRGEAEGSWQASHFTYQIRTFWVALAVSVLGGLSMVIGVGFVILAAIGVWMIYRVIKGWVRLSQYRAVENPEGWF